MSRGCHLFVALYWSVFPCADAKNIEVLQRTEEAQPHHRSSLIATANLSIATPTHVKMPLLGRKFPAQIGMLGQIAGFDGEVQEDC